ncbi:MAG: DMT family transporter [Candidatus Chisholmbacteria bacterium]|nr:DMT family transporter [Candidatus Chisholmbacteria bacterium]
MVKNTDRLTLLMFTVGVLITGTNFVAVKFSNQELAPFWGAALRFFLAALVFLLYMLIKRVPLPKGRELRGAVLYGVVGFGGLYGFMYWGLQWVPAGVASLIVALLPLLTHLLARVHKLEELRLRSLVGSGVALGGIGLIFSEQLTLDVPLMPLLLLVVATVCGAETGIIIKLYAGNRLVTMNGVGMMIGALLLLILSQISGETVSLPRAPETVLALTYLVIASVVLFVSVILVIRRWTASAAAYQLVLAPLVTLVVAAVLRGEEITTISVLGGVIVLLGVYIGALANSRG